MIQEPESQTFASETVHGLSGEATKGQTKIRNQLSFFGEAKNSGELQKIQCKVCGNARSIELSCL